MGGASSSKLPKELPSEENTKMGASSSSVSKSIDPHTAKSAELPASAKSPQENLVSAIKKNNLEMLRFLVGEVNYNSSFVKKGKFLLVAIQEKNTSAFKILLENGHKDALDVNSYSSVEKKIFDMTDKIAQKEILTMFSSSMTKSASKG